MSETISFSKTVPVCGQYDVIVAGGGLAGVAAAVSAKRMGKSVLIIEKTVGFGGLGTIGLINLFVPMCNGRGTQIIKGMCQEMVEKSIQYGFDSIPKDWQNGEPGEGNTKERYRTKYSAEIFTLVLTDWVKNEGVDILFDSVVTDTVMENNVCKGVVVDNKSGFEYYEAKMVVDATGDADVLYRSGVPTVQGTNFDTFCPKGATLEDCKKAVEEKNIGCIDNTRFPGGIANLYGKNHPEGKKFWLGTTAQDVTEYFIENHIKSLDRFKDGRDRFSRIITRLPTMPQFRTTRRIDGDYTFRESDVYKHFDDSIGAICDFERRNLLFEMPYRTMVRSGFPNLITAGRCTSGEKYGWDLLRVIPPAIISGQAAGVACALAIDNGNDLFGFDIKELQSILENQNVIIHFDDNLVYEITDEDLTVDVGHM